ncbi:MAG: YebC/PmpR family DNA-binding transcriptional regulator [Limnochordia bacterium]|jgi:YebC/PmpR family DNA-binding regulatory protein
MAGHSKWANIKHKKAKEDARRGKVFTRLSRELTVAAREGGGDPNANQRLRLAIERARAVNMPNDNIERAIKRGTGELEGSNYEEIVYEGYGPGGVAIMMEIMTDNRNRTAGDIRHLFSKYGGSLGETGCVSWMFEKKGYLTMDLAQAGGDEDVVMLAALEAGAEDVQIEDGLVEVFTAPEDFNEVLEGLRGSGLPVEEAKITMLPQNTVEVDEATAEPLLKLMGVLEDHDDIQEVYANFDIPDELLEKLDQ